MSVNSYLESLASTLVLSEIEENNISTSVSKIKERLDYYFSDINEKIIFGSYSRGTILPRRADEKSDVDIMVVFDNSNGYKPQSFINRLKGFAEYYYKTSEIHQSNPTVVLKLNHIKFELVPAYKTYNSYYIPNGPSNWMYTDPTGFHSTLLTCNKNNSYKIKPVIRLLKHWDIAKNNRHMASFVLEKQIAEEMNYSFINCTSYIDYIKEALRIIKYTTDWDKVNTALNHINTAIDYENNNMPYTALSEIKKIFPDV